MSKIFELSNPYFKSINSSYYKGEVKRNILDCKKMTLQKISKENVLGLSYVIEPIEGFDGRSINDTIYGEAVSEYVIVSVNLKDEINLETFEIKNEKLLLCIPLCKIVFGDVKLANEYKNNLDKFGYVQLPSNFICLENSKLISLFENERNKFNVKKK